MSTQGEIDELGGGKTIRDWENRFELAYEQCKDENVTLVGGVAPVAIRKTCGDTVQNQAAQTVAERVLGAPSGSLPLVDAETMMAWFAD